MSVVYSMKVPAEFEIRGGYELMDPSRSCFPGQSLPRNFLVFPSGLWTYDLSTQNLVLIPSVDDTPNALNFHPIERMKQIAI
jgi:hypothetical protein